MAHCVQFVPKGETEPKSLNAIDEELCALLHQPVHPTDWVENWMNVHGLLFAAGLSPTEVQNAIIEDYADVPERRTRLIFIYDHLTEHYDITAFRRHGFA